MIMVIIFAGMVIICDDGDDDGDYMQSWKV